MKILIADDHELFLEGLKLTLKGLKDTGSLHLVETHNYPELLARAAGEKELSLILMDLTMPGMPWARALPRIVESAPETPIVILSAVYDRPTVFQALEMGAAGFIPKTSAPKVILAAIEEVLEGGAYIPPEFVDRKQAGHGRLLTPRQEDVLRLLCQGKANKAIAYDLSLTEGTVKLHISSIFKALGVSNRTAAILAARTLGLVGEDGAP